MEHLLTTFCEKQGVTDGIKDFLTVLMLYREYDEDRVNAAVELAAKVPLGSSAGVVALLAGDQTGAAKPAPESLPSWPQTPVPDLTVYSQLEGES